MISYGDQEELFPRDYNSTCFLSPKILEEIQSYKPTVDKIIETVVSGEFKGKTYSDLAFFVDTFGSRISGSQALEDSIDFMFQRLQNSGLENVKTEPVQVPHWERGEESAELLSPRRAPLFILGLGRSVGTPPAGITAEAIVVSTFEELTAKADQVPGKIVVYNEEFTTYSKTVKFRLYGAKEAAKLGAVAALIRSIGDFSLRTPHTGEQVYDGEGPRIPVACISMEDAEMLGRMYEWGDTIVIRLKMGAVTYPEVISRNTMGDIIGRERPEEFVIVSGHIDSWDVGQGALDDGAGMMLAYQTVLLFRYLGLIPRRTVRNVFWTAEEFQHAGLEGYAAQHEAELENVSAIVDSDSGTFLPFGVDFWGNEEAACIMAEIIGLLNSINVTEVQRETGYPDIFIAKGVPQMTLLTYNGKYFWYHHTEADTMSALKPRELDLCTAAWASITYVLAELSMKLPRTEGSPTGLPVGVKLHPEDDKNTTKEEEQKQENNE